MFIWLSQEIGFTVRLHVYNRATMCTYTHTEHGVMYSGLDDLIERIEL